MPEPVLLFDAVVEVVDGLDAPRCAVIRSGEREPINLAVRRAVYRRDRGRCDWCYQGGLLELDHIIPWSAGGSDRSDNLRLMCHYCNAQRSNYPDPGRPRRLPCTYFCDDCHGRLPDEDAVRCYCATCGRPSYSSDLGMLI